MLSFDKTGTLTCGTLSIGQTQCMADLTKTQALAIAAALETGSRHPIAAAFTVFADNALVAEEVHHEVGFGVRGELMALITSLAMRYLPVRVLIS